jgi:hypothetical protein
MTLYINTILPDHIMLMIAKGEETLVLKKIKVNRNQAEKLLSIFREVIVGI